MPTDSNPCPKSEMIKRITTNVSLQPPYEAATINIAEMTEAKEKIEVINYVSFITLPRRTYIAQ